MRDVDVAAAAEAVRRGDWGERESFFEFAARHAQCQPVVAVEGDEIVGTGVGTVNGPVGWIGTIWVAPDRRQRGLGRALTEVVIDGLEAAGCRTLVLVATEAGRRVYEKLGFEVLTEHTVLAAPGLPRDEAEAGQSDPRALRRFTAEDLPAACQLDRAGTGEDRSHLLRAFAADGWSIHDEVGELRAFAVRSGFRGLAVIAPDPADAERLLEHERRLVGPEGRTRTGLLDANREGRARLEAAGWTELWSGVRMCRGEPLAWQPTWIWGQFSQATG